MSNFLAVATVTASLRRRLEAAVAQDVSGAVVTTVRPDEGIAGLPETGVNLFLYQVSPNPDLCNLDLPSRRPDGSLVQRPEAAIDLCYLLTFYGDDATLEPQRILGSVVRTLHSRPFVDRTLVEDTVADPTFSYLAGSDLGAASQTVNLQMWSLSPSQHYELWSGPFGSLPFQLSTVYKASVVLLTSEDPPPPTPRPVAERRVLVGTFRRPRLDSATAAGGPGAALEVGAELVLAGRRLASDATRVRLAGLEAEPSSVSDAEVRVTLDAPAFDVSQLRAGVGAVQVLANRRTDGGDELAAGSSNVLPVVLRPRVLSAAVSGETDAGAGRVNADLALTLTPPVGERQSVAVYLDPASGSTASGSYSARSDERPSATASPVLALEGVEPGEYLLRVEVDGAESLPVRDDDPMSPSYGLYTGPTITVGTP